MIGKIRLATLLDCYDRVWCVFFRVSAVSEEQIYRREESRSQTVETAKLQQKSQEIWGGPCTGTYQSDIPKVKAYVGELPMKFDQTAKIRGLEFLTEVPPDSGTRPGLAYWSGKREGVRNEDGYAKIKVSITFCNQLDEV